MTYVVWLIPLLLRIAILRLEQCSGRESLIRLCQGQYYTVQELPYHFSAAISEIYKFWNNTPNAQPLTLESPMVHRWGNSWPSRCLSVKHLLQIWSNLRALVLMALCGTKYGINTRVTRNRGPALHPAGNIMVHLFESHAPVTILVFFRY